jgi:hypothetical protein
MLMMTLIIVEIWDFILNVLQQIGEFFKFEFYKAVTIKNLPFWVVPHCNQRDFSDVSEERSVYILNLEQ